MIYSILAHNRWYYTMQDDNSIEVVLVLLSCRYMWVKYISALKRSKLQLRWKLCGKTWEEVQLSRPRPKSGDGGIVCFAIRMPRLSMQQCLEIWMKVLSGLSCKQAHRHRHTQWNLDQKWNQEEMKKGSQSIRMIKSWVIRLLAKWEASSHPKN